MANIKVVVCRPPKRFARIANGQRVRVCRVCGAFVHGSNRGICNRCLNQGKVARHGK